MLNPLTPIRKPLLWVFLLSVTLFELLTYMASDMVMPAMLSVVDELDADAIQVPQSFYLYLLGGIVLQWLIGPLSDHFGRRPLLLTGCALFTLACVAMLQVTNIQLFQGLRVVQGMALGFVVAVSYPALQELFCEADAVRLMAWLGNLALLSPLLGPLLGSLLLEWLSWRELFGLLAAVGALTWLGLFCSMPETLAAPPGPKPNLNLWRIVRRYIALAGNYRFVLASVALGLMGLPLVAWIGQAPLLLIEDQGMTPVEYGLAQVPVFTAVILGNLLLGKLVGRISLPALLQCGLWPLAGGLGLLLLSSSFNPPLGVVLIGLSLYGVGLGMSHATLYRLALDASDDSKGLVSAMIGMLSIGVMGAGGSLLNVLDAGLSLGAFALIASLAGLIYLLPVWGFLRTSPIAAADLIQREFP